jgi:hypothetical protein
MGFRFSKRIKILPGVSINLSKSGVSASVGPRGAKINIGKRGVRANVGLPGTGMSYSTKITSIDDRGSDTSESYGSPASPPPAAPAFRPARPNPTGFAPRNAPNPTGFAPRMSTPELEVADEPSHLPEAYPAEPTAEAQSGSSSGVIFTALLLAFGGFLLFYLANG